MYHSHTSDTDFSEEDYFVISPGESNYLGTPNEERVLRRTLPEVDENGISTRPSMPLTQGWDRDGVLRNYTPRNKALRAMQR